MVLVALVLIVLHSGSGDPIDVNVDEITSMRRAEQGHAHVSKTVHCWINLTDGRFVTVQETCDEVKKAIRENHK